MLLKRLHKFFSELNGETFTVGIVSKPDVILSNEKLQTEPSKEWEKIRISPLKICMTISEPKKSNYLK